MLHTADDFLRAIEAEPGDRTRRLVFADWLDEHSDPRGELIRVEEEMRTLPVFSDRFWELKPWRNELRKAVGPEWCGRMRYGTECEPVFRHGIPDGWRERWRLIREFTERWHRVPMPDVGSRYLRVVDAKIAAKVDLPPSIREYVSFKWDVREDDDSFEELNGTFHVGTVPGQPVVPLLMDSAGNYYGVRHADLKEPDPPVRYCGYRQDDHTGDGEWVLVPESRSAPQPVTGWAFDMLIQNVASRPESVVFELRDAARLAPELERHLSPRVRVGSSTLIEADNILIQIRVRAATNRTTLWVTCQRALGDTEIPAVLRDMLRPENQMYLPSKPGQF